MKDEDVGFTWLDKAIVWLGKRLSLVFAAIVVCRSTRLSAVMCLIPPRYGCTKP